MEITRKGTDRDQGYRAVYIDNPNIEYDTATNSLIITASNVKDFGYVTAHHDYRIIISLAEFAGQLREISKATESPNAGAVASSLQSNLSDLLRIALACAPTQE